MLIRNRTGVGGQIREVISTGNGAKVMGGAAGFFVGNLNIPGYEQPWEEHNAYPSMFVDVVIVIIVIIVIILVIVVIPIIVVIVVIFNIVIILNVLVIVHNI